MHMRSIARSFLSITVLAFRCTVVLAHIQLFPPTIPAVSYSNSTTTPSRHWTVADIVEVTRIKGIAIQGSSRNTAFLLQRPSLEDGKNHYALYEINLKHGGEVRKLFEADYIADLASRPGTAMWTVRADIGEGIQLYEIDADGAVRRLLIIPRLVIIGGYSGIQSSATEEPRATGVVSYEWAPDGHAFWYSRIRLRAVNEQEEVRDRGLAYDDTTATGPMSRNIERSVRLLGTELHVFNVLTGTDREIAFSPSGTDDFDEFRKSVGSAAWEDSAYVQYRLRIVENGLLRYSLMRENVESGQALEIGGKANGEIYNSIPALNGFLTVRQTGSENHLVRVGEGGKLKDFGPVDFSRVGGGMFGILNHAGQMAFAVQREDRYGLAAIPTTKGWNAIRKNPDFMSQCAFNADLSYGACSRETLTLAPELVSIEPSKGTISILSRPNARYDEIPPLRSTAAKWTNRYGFENTGYVTYPRDYTKGKRYPALLVTHALDAMNAFARDAFQWEFPVQVFAERGYLVLSVNETRSISSTPPPYVADASKIGSERERFYQGYCPLATMEAVASAAIASGDVDPKRIGIAGYSIGSTVTRFVMSHSTLFAAGSSAESSWWDAGGFAAGSELSRIAYTNLLGGSPFDPNAYGNYVAFAPSARATNFAGPLLQQFADASAGYAVEMDQMLKQAGIPTYLVAFPDEAHIFWHPRHRASAMEQNLDWFDYWLLGERNSSAEKAAQYNQWDRMNDLWMKGRQTPGSR